MEGTPSRGALFLSVEYRNLAGTGVQVSSICLGTAFHGLWHGLSDEQACIDTIHRFLELGGNFIDCANFYQEGRCESLLGRTLKGLPGKRDELVITSKVCSTIGEGPNDGGLSRYHIMREIERTLTRLGTDHVDLYLLHHFDPETPLGETLRAMDDLVHQGKVRYVGCSNFTAAQVVEALWVSDRFVLQPVACLQHPYNLLNRAIEGELFSCCRQHRLGVMAYSPLGTGLLTGAIRVGKPPPSVSVWSQRKEREEEIAKVDHLVQLLVDRAEALSMTPAQLAVAWILDHDEVSTAIIGPDLPEHVDDVVGSGGWRISADTRAALDEAFLR